MAFERELAAVQRWVDETDRIALSHFRVDVPYETKSDGTPVTEADRAVEESLRRAIATEFPGDAIVGEEQGGADARGRVWVVDPIDGTKNFSRGVPVFATLVALEEDGRPLVGMVSAPALGTRWWSVAGGGAFRDGEAIRVSATASIEHADVCTGGIDWAQRSDRLAGVLRLFERARRMRGFGDFWGHMLVAQGSLEAMVELAPLARWDVAACKAIVLEAGGRMSSLDGDDSIVEGPAVTTNGPLHDEVLAILASG